MERKLKIVDVDMATGGEFVTDAYTFKRKCEVMGIPQKQITEMIIKQVEPQKKQLIDLGLTEEEAEKKINELITEETQPDKPKEA